MRTRTCGLTAACLVLTSGFALPPAAAAAEEGANGESAFASDDNSLKGDHLKLRVNVAGFQDPESADPQKKWCGPKGSKLKVTEQTADDIYVYFKSIPDPLTTKDPGMFSTAEAPDKAALKACAEVGMVNDYTQYKLPLATVEQRAFRRTGILFGALVVPFKYYLGDDSKLSASSTIAPFVGYRGPAPLDLTFTPVVSAGLGLVPVTDAASGESETKPALSTAVGVLLTHSKNDKFNAGVLFGKDFLSKTDRAGDQSVDNLWFSLYAGYSL